MKARTIYYIDENEDYLDVEAKIAASRTPDENLEAYCETIIANYAMMNINVANYPVKRVIYYMEDEQVEK